VWGESASTFGYGVYGKAPLYAVRGYATATSGYAYGVLGLMGSTSGSAVHGQATAASGTTHGVRGESASTSGRGVYGYATATSGTTHGVHGQTASTSGRGVYGYATATSGTTHGVHGQTASTSGRGVYGYASTSSGTTYGVYGEAASTSGYGVYGRSPICGVHGYASHTGSGWTYGVIGESKSTSGRGVYGHAFAGTGTTYGLYGWSESTSGRGVYGYASSPTGFNYGVYGKTNSSTGYAGYFTGGYGVHIVGNLSCTGTKPFVQQHPEDPTKEIVYVALEGPEAGTYIRGTAELRDGEARVVLPDHFALVTCEDGLTVQVTPVGHWLQLYVVDKSPLALVIREASGRSGRFDYLVQGIRKGYEHHQVIRDRTPRPARPMRLGAGLPRDKQTLPDIAEK
jgi:hypothetical protein